MFKCFKKAQIDLHREVFGLSFRNQLGTRLSEDAGLRQRRASSRMTKTAFLTLTPPKDNILNWFSSLPSIQENAVLAVNLRENIIKNFALAYDFADFIIIDPDSDSGIDAADLADTRMLLDEIVSLRLCYEKYTPILMRLSHGCTEEEMQLILSSCRLYGLDGVVSPNPAMTRQIQELTDHRLPIMTTAKTVEEAQLALVEGSELVELEMRPVTIQKLLKTLEI